tara:strand:- start:580 stop:777 length:198 start_codon:yes stop_codon:yes gene_type:complete
MDNMKFRSMGGLKVKDGRLINDRPDGISGIAEASMLKKAVKNAKKIEKIADGISLAERRKGFYEM